MSWYVQAKTDELELDVETPEELLEWMDCIEYGWMDKDYKEKNDFGNEFWDDYSMLLPHEVLEHKVGVCWDQTVFENHIFDNQFDFPHHMIFVQQFKVSTHAFLVYEKDDGWYWFEHSFDDNKGIHGPFESVQDIVVEVFDTMEEFKGGSKGFDWTVMDPEEFKKKLTCKEFMDLCDYNYEEMEETDRQSTE